MNLDALGGDMDGNFAGKVFGHACFAGEAHVFLIGKPGGLIDKQARGFHLSSHVGELELNGLKVGDGLVELLAFLGVARRRLEGALRHAKAQGCDRNAAPVEDFQAADEAFAFRAEQVFPREAAIGEDDFGRVAGTHAQLVFFLARTEARSALFEDESADAVRVFGLIGDGHGHADVGVGAIGGEGFGAIQNPALAVADRGRAGATGVGTRFGLGERPSS